MTGRQLLGGIRFERRDTAGHRTVFAVHRTSDFGRNGPVCREEGDPVPNRGVTERRIAEAALRLVVAEGVDGLSMRKLAQDVGVAPMSLYTYYPDREAVLEAAAQLLLAEVELPDDDLDWRETVRQ